MAKPVPDPRLVDSGSPLGHKGLVAVTTLSDGADLLNQEGLFEDSRGTDDGHEQFHEVNKGEGDKRTRREQDDCAILRTSCLSWKHSICQLLFNWPWIPESVLLEALPKRN